MQKSVQTNQLIHYSVIIRSIKNGPNDYTKWWLDDFPKRLAQKMYDEYLIGNFVIGEETAGEENNYDHLQCYIRLRKRLRVNQLLSLLLDMYEWPDPSLVQVQPSPSPRSLSAYCQKQGTFHTDKDFLNLYEKEIMSLELNEEQVEINDHLYKDSSDRKIILVQNVTGGIGKTTLIKRWMVENKYDVFLFPQSGSLMSNLYCYARWYQNVRSAPTDRQVLVAINCPKSDNRLAKKESIAEFLSSVEAIKDCMFSACFNGKLITINGSPKSVRVVIMTNAPVQVFREGLSEDRLELLIYDKYKK